MNYKEMIKRGKMPEELGGTATNLRRKKVGNVVIYDSDEVPEYNPDSINRDPGSVYNAASSVL